MGGSCLAMGEFNCFWHIRGQYLQSLYTGFLLPDRRFHPALKYIAVMNEPDMKMPPDVYRGSPEALKMWTHSVNTFNHAASLPDLFFNRYTETFPNTPVYVGEYHIVGANQVADLSVIKQLPQQIPLLLDFAFFEFMKAY